MPCPMGLQRYGFRNFLNRTYLVVRIAHTLSPNSILAKGRQQSLISVPDHFTLMIVLHRQVHGAL